MRKQVIEIDYNNRTNYFYRHISNKDVIIYAVILDELIKLAAKSKENNYIQWSIDKSQFDEVFLTKVLMLKKKKKNKNSSCI